MLNVFRIFNPAETALLAIQRIAVGSSIALSDKPADAHSRCAGSLSLDESFISLFPRLI
jgi:hypothetical protein